MPGAQYVNGLKFSASTAVVVTGGGAITVTRDQHTVTDAGGPGAGADDLDTITKINVDEGDEVKLQITAGGSSITLRHAAGNIRCPYSTDITLSDATDYAVLRYAGPVVNVWNVIKHRVLANVPNDNVIVGGVIAVRRPEHTVRGEGAAADDLDTVTGGVLGREVVLRAGAEAITLRHNIGANGIELPGGDNIVLATARDYVKLRWDGTAWKVTEACTARGPAGIEGSNVAAGTDGNVVGCVPLVFRAVIPNGAGNTDIVVDYGIRVTRAWFVKTTAVGDGDDTVRVFNLGNAISNLMIIPVAVNALVRSASIDTAQHQINAGGTLRFTTAQGGAGLGNTQGIGYVLAQNT